MDFEIVEINISKEPNTEAAGGCKHMAMIDICSGGDAPCPYEKCTMGRGVESFPITDPTNWCQTFRAPI